MTMSLQKLQLVSLKLLLSSKTLFPPDPLIFPTVQWWPVPSAPDYHGESEPGKHQAEILSLLTSGRSTGVPQADGDLPQVWLPDSHVR